MNQFSIFFTPVRSITMFAMLCIMIISFMFIGTEGFTVCLFTFVVLTFILNIYNFIDLLRMTK